MQILNEKYSKIILEEKLLLTNLLAEIEILSDDDLRNKLTSVIENLENLFSIVFIGEFSTGKSSIINTLLGLDVLAEGITPTTDEITVIKYGDQTLESIENGSRLISIPEERLKGILLVDTPGTNVTIAQHQKITEEFIPKADIVFFTIGAERAVTGSEAKLIEFIKEEWLKNIVFVLNKIDVAKDQEELDQLISHTSGELERAFSFKPHVIPVSAKLARQAKASSDSGLYTKSGFAELEEYIFKTLGEEERVRLKIQGSSELALSLCSETEKAIDANLYKISQDTEKLAGFQRKLDGMKDEIIGNSSQFTERIRSRLLEFKTRGVQFIDDLIRIQNILKLISKDKVAKEFEYKVSRQTVAELEKDLDSMVSWTEKSARTLLDSTINFYNNSIKSEAPSMSSGFTYDRTRLIDTVRSELETKRKSIDPSVLGGNLVDSARGAVASVLGVQVGTLAIGTAVVTAFSSFIVDITGILATIAVMATAFAILPKKRRDAMKEFNHKVDALIEELTSSVSSQLKRDFDGISLQVTDSLVPLKNFYKIETEKLEESKKRVREIRQKIESIKNSSPFNT
ncbi:MAG: dynamin family protein [Candidatus Dadabacteria bacterium]